MNVTGFDSKRAAERWDAFVQELPVRPIPSDADYDQMVALMNQLLEVVGYDEKYPLAPVLALVTIRSRPTTRITSRSRPANPARSCGF